MAGEPEERWILLFDGACGPCAAFARAVGALDARQQVRLVPLQHEPARRRFEPRLGPAYWQSFHLVAPGGTPVVSGPRALGTLGKLLPALCPFVPFVSRTPGLRRLPAAAYGAVARARSCTARPTHG